MKKAVKEAIGISLRITVTVFLAELVVMLLLMQWPELDPLLSSLLDATALTLILAPALYLLVYRPVKREIDERRKAEHALRQSLHSQQLLNQQLTDAQNQLLESEKLVSIGHLAAGVAHEINNPIGYVSSNLATLDTYTKDLMTLLEHYESCHALIEQDATLFTQTTQIREKVDIDYLSADIRSLLDESKEGLVRVKKIVLDLKLFSRNDEGIHEAIDLNAEIERTLNLAHNEIKYHLQLDLQLDPLPLIECIPSRINQVLLNILVNATQAIKGKGTISIRTQALENDVRISIADSGCGIPAEQLKRIFDPFYTTKPRGEGTGLGLSVSWGIINKHGGRIEVDSKPGEGSCFHIYLPLQRDSAVSTISSQTQACKN
ncbi:MAG: ATP-binding protein [Halopseudomonas sp.]